ncbi:MAG: hypothetical protein ACJ77K_16460 [Bacteroidia bacterium]
MYKEHLLQNIEREYHLLKRLAMMIEEKDLDYRQAEKQRSTYELMQYLSRVGAFMFRWMLDNDITPEVRKEAADYSATLTVQNFPQRIDEQLSIIRKYMAGISEEELLTRKVILPWKEEMVLGSAIINAPIKWLAAYRMELFRNLKLSGNREISTRHAWDPVEEVKQA